MSQYEHAAPYESEQEHLSGENDYLNYDSPAVEASLQAEREELAYLDRHVAQALVAANPQLQEAELEGPRALPRNHSPLEHEKESQQVRPTPPLDHDAQPAEHPPGDSSRSQIAMEPV